jgi:predicted amidohydrolase YtcJ
VRFCGCFLVLALIPACAAAQPAPRHADRIFIDGVVWTGEDAAPRAEAIAVSGDRILAVGSDAEIRALAGADTAAVDLHGRLVVPGFQDSHLHFPGPSVNQVNLVGAESVQEIQRRLLEFAKAHPSLPWIVGAGWGYAAFPQQTVDKKYIDAVIPDRPVYLYERDEHMGLANSRAIAAAGVDAHTADPPNGRIMRERDGSPTGEFKEAAQALIAAHIPAETADDRYQSLLLHMDEAAAAGLTSVQDAATTMDLLALFERAAAAGALKVRVHFSPLILPADESGFPRDHKLAKPLTEADLGEYRRLRDLYRGPMLKFESIKGFLDGTVDAKTAAMFEPYVGGGTGIPFWEQDDLNRTVALYDEEGFQVMLHAIGDKAIDMALNAYAYAEKTNGTSGRRHRIEHVEVPKLSDLPRFRELGVIASTQPMFANPDATTLGNFAVLLGPERAAHADSFRIFDDAGAVQAFGSDWPVFAFPPLPAIYCAVTRMTPEGTPAGGWYPQGRISVEAALRHYTRDGAYATFEEKERGTLAAGKLADFVVLSRDILTAPPPDILKTEVLLTVMGGRDTYRDASF